MTTVILNQPDEPQDVPGVVIPAPETGDAVIKNTFFFPDVDPKRVRELMRLEQTVSDARLRNAIKTGMAEKSVTTTGRPHACASMMGMPKPSEVVAASSTSPARRC